MKKGKRITRAGFLNKAEEKTGVEIICGWRKERKRYTCCLRKDIHYYNFMFRKKRTHYVHDTGYRKKSSVRTL